MSKINQYVPILTPKRGELTAIKELSLDALSKITPLFDVHRIPIFGGKRSKTLNCHLDGIVNCLSKYWDKNNYFLLDSSLLNLSFRMDDGSHPMKYLCDKLKQKGMNFSPVIGLDRDSEYLGAVRDFLLQYPNCSLSIRLLQDDLYTDMETSFEIAKYLAYFGVVLDRCHLLIDFKYIESKDIENIIELLAAFNQTISFDSWCSFTLVASGFPLSLSSIPADSNQGVRRVEYDLWCAAIEASPLIGRKPRFGDYCIAHPEKPEVDLRTMRAGGKIRYTTTVGWEIFRGYSLQKREKFAQYRSLSKKVVVSPHFLGASYSWGDGYLEKCANDQEKTGNLETWVKVDTNHHLTLVGAQIANSGAF